MTAIPAHNVLPSAGDVVHLADIPALFRGRIRTSLIAGVLAVAGTLLFAGLIAPSAQADSCASLYPLQPPRPTLSANLPDCRAFEQVNPVFKGGSNLDPIAVSPDAQRVLYGAYGAFTGSSGGAREVFFNAIRSPGGWVSSGALPPASDFFAGTQIGYPGGPFDVTPNLNRLMMFLNPPGASNDLNASSPALYLVTADQSAPPVSIDPADDPGSTGNPGITLLGASKDFSHILLGLLLGSPLVPGDPTASRINLTEDVNLGTEKAPDYHYRLVGLDNSGNPTSLVSNCSEGASLFVNKGGTLLGSGSGELSAVIKSPEHTLFHAISVDGSRVFFTALPCVSLNFGAGTRTEQPADSELFVRVNGDKTIPISAPPSAGCPYGTFAGFVPPPDPCADATFEGASADGSKVYFTTVQPETGSSDTTNNLYEAVIGESSVEQMTQVSAGDSSGGGAQVQGVVRVSDDGSHVYFVAHGVLTAAANSEGDTAQTGADNLYEADAGGADVHFIGSLSSADSALWGVDSGREAQTTDDGRFIVFDSFAQLTPDDTDTAKDVYKYDAQSGELTRISVGNNGYDGNGNDGGFDASIEPPGYASLGASAGVDVMMIAGGRRALSADGSYVFFTTKEQLQPGDQNGAQDVYEWHVGRVSLISDGENLHTNYPGPGYPGATRFVAASKSGSDALFLTTSVLTPAGGDGAFDIYDARVGGGFPFTVPSPGCQGDACQGALSSTPGAAAPGSASFTGPGNTPEKPLNKTKKPKKHKPKKKANKHKNRTNTNRRASK